MRTKVHWIEGLWPGRLAILPRPRGEDWLKEDIRSCQQTGLDLIVSLLTSDENAELGLTGEAMLCQAYSLPFLSFPIVDRGVPSSRAATSDFVRNRPRA